MIDGQLKKVSQGITTLGGRSRFNLDVTAAPVAMARSGSLVPMAMLAVFKK
jgi:hypothetical protein